MMMVVRYRRFAEHHRESHDAHHKTSRDSPLESAKRDRLLHIVTVRHTGEAAAAHDEIECCQPATVHIHV